MQETWVQSLCWEDPLEKRMATYSSILAWRIKGAEEPAGPSPWGHTESDTTESLIPGAPRWCRGKKKNLPANAGATRDAVSIPGLGRSPGGGNGGESPWTEEPGGLQSMESHRVGHH